jgi:hypothetical protein
MTAIYEALKSIGFRETYWQLVYPGQIGGLIKNPRGTLIEFHVRFFQRGMIYGEMELGRSVFLHFVNHRCYINCYLVTKIGSRLCPAHIDYLRVSTERFKRVYPRQRPEWTRENRFMTPNIKRQIQFLTLLADWRALALIMLASIGSTMANGPAALLLVIALMIFVYLLAPKRF